MTLARRMYRGCKVWVELDEQGRLVDRNGLVKVRYREDAPDSEAYSAKLSEVNELDPNAPPPVRREPRPRRTGGGAASEAPRARDAGGRSARDAVVIYTDGSCFGNPGPAGVGVLLEWKGRTREVSRFIGDGTNNIAELTAIQVALEQVKNRRLPVRLHTDSAYAIGVLSGGWKVNENKALVAAIQDLMRSFADLKFVKVRGHEGDPRNERVDQLARDAIARRA